MRRIGRYILNALTALSLLLCVATAVAWVRSYTWTDRLSWGNRSCFGSVYSAEGRAVLVLYVRDWSRLRDKFHGLRHTSEPAQPALNVLLMLGGDRGDRFTSWERGRLSWYQVRNPGIGKLYAFATAPFWSLALVTALLPAGRVALRFAARFRRRKPEPGLCPACGYDLRATPDRCPECGRPCDHPAP